MTRISDKKIVTLKEGDSINYGSLRIGSGARICIDGTWYLTSPVRDYHYSLMGEGTYIETANSVYETV